MNPPPRTSQRMTSFCLGWEGVFTKGRSGDRMGSPAGHSRGSDVQWSISRRWMVSPTEDVPGDLSPPLPPLILHECDCQGNEQRACWG
jgi:hypothetical protein